MSDDKPRAFILTGAFYVICRNPRYLTELVDRNLKVLVITSASYRDQALASMKDLRHPASAVDDIVFVDGELSVEGSFTAGCIAAAQEWRRKYTVVGVHSVGETVVDATGLLADGFGLRGPGLRATRASRSKHLQRWYLPEFSPPSVVVPPAERAAFDWSRVEFPAVVKPASRHSSSGVATVSDRMELLEQVMSYPPHEVILVEKKVVGQEFSVESLVQDGDAILASVTRKETTESSDRTFVELSHSVPHTVPAECELLLDANRRMLDLLAFRDGIAHSEWRIDGAGRPYLMEVAVRTPGDGLTVLYQLATGRPMEPEVIRIALGEPASYPALRRYTRQVYLEHEPATLLQDVTVDWPGVQPVWVGENAVWPEIEAGGADEPPTLRAVLVLKETGAELGPLLSSADRAVTFLIDAPTPEQLDEVERRVRAAITIHATPARPFTSRRPDASSVRSA
ncbi:ATP-grasp domain-containing protein [Dactylosporangium sp. CA-092794]|uniref:ATP-grasp domain-containing protein n=1 Tax=Dactylosporangium sp. CA-092794 TaxID=3239929 RepID=UPI003D8AB26B